MSKYVSISFLFTLFCGLSLISSTVIAQDQSATTESASKVVAVVNGEPISQELFDAYIQQRRAQIGDRINDPEVKQALIDAIVSQELLIQEAREQNLTQDPQVAAQLEQLELQMKMAERNLLTRAMINKVLTENPPSEEAIEKEYKALEGQQEYKASHILVDSKEKAESIIEKLTEGLDFAGLAKSESMDNSASQGGDLGWFTTEMMVQPFSEAVTQLEPGEYTKEPVETQFGWHVIKLEDVRETTPPPMEQVRARIVQQLQGPVINDYVAELREQAEVEIKE